MKRFIEWELENNPHMYDKPRCDEYIDKQTLTHVICNVDCPEGVSHEVFTKVLNEVAETLDIFPYNKQKNDSAKSLYWVTLLIDDSKTGYRVWPCAWQDACLSLEEALQKVEKARSSHNVIMVWIDSTDADHNNTKPVYHKCYLDY